MPVVVLLGPIVSTVSSLCSVDDWKYMKKRGFDGSVANITTIASVPKLNVITFPKIASPETHPIGNSRCKRCSADKFVLHKENRICSFCGESGYYESQSPAVFSTVPTRNYNHDVVKRVAHFKNWIARLQGKERCNISKENLRDIGALIVQFPDTTSDHDRIKMALKQLGLQKYYNNVYYIMRQLLGHALVEFRKINEARLLALFMRIQEPFSRIENGRTNMMSYQFLIRKFCELLGYSLAQYIPLLKSRSNLQRQDYIWRCICEELGLPFYPSV